MNNSVNILKEVMRDENEVTRLLYALCAYKPFREVLFKFLTSGSYGADDVAWEDMGVQTTIDGVKPDFYALGESFSLLAEIKTSLYTRLTASQPSDYLAWLARHPSPGKRFFVALIPSMYVHREELKNRLASWLTEQREPLVTATILEWEGFLESLHTSGLQQLNRYLSDFYGALWSWFTESPIKLSYHEVEKMYARETASGIANLFKLVEKVATEMQKSYPQTDRSFSKRWWDNGEYGIYIRQGDRYILWFGIWQSYWEYSGVPLCYGVEQKWDDVLVEKFQSLHPKYFTFPKGNPNPYFLENINKEVFLAEDQVGKIVGLLENELLSLSPKVDSSSNSQLDS